LDPYEWILKNDTKPLTMDQVQYCIRPS